MKTVLILLFATLLSGAGKHGDQPKTRINPPKTIPDFTLQDHTGKSVKLSDYKGHWKLVFFGFTNCHMVCPTTLNAIKNELASAGAQAKKVKVLFISVDPKRDTQKRLAAYIPPFGPQFVGLRGPDKDIRKIADTFGAFFKENKKRVKKINEDDILHSSFVYLLNPKGEWHTLYDFPVESNVVAQDLKGMIRL